MKVAQQILAPRPLLVAVLLVAAAAVHGIAAENTLVTNVPASRSAETNSEITNFGEKFQARVVTNAPAPGQSTNLSSAKPKNVEWDFSWNGWNGLQLGVSTETHLKNPREVLGLSTSSNAPVMHLEELKMTATLGALLEVDAAAYRTTGTLNIPDDIQLRRARLKASGDCILILPVSYDFELGYIPSQFNIEKAMLTFPRVDYIGYLVTGIFKPPMSLDMTTSSRDITFMEPATVLQSLAPSTEAGIQIGQPVLNQRVTWALGIFGGGFTTTEYGNASQNYGNLIGRLTWLALDHVAPEKPDENRYLHLGLSANIQYSPSSSVRYRSRPESYISDFVIDTGRIDADASAAFCGEVAYVNGPFCVQGEFLDSPVRELDGENVNFYGFYAGASWYLTGESRPYDRFKGCFKRLVPRHNFDFGRNGDWGAFEVAARFSYTDLDDRNVQGGKIHLLMGELNWYLHSHVRWMFNAGGGQVTGSPSSNGSILLFQTRVGVDF